jgi:hypothetical protein
MSEYVRAFRRLITVAFIACVGTGGPRRLVEAPGQASAVTVTGEAAPVN